MKKNLLIAQSGGPTAAINATLAGVVQTGLLSASVDKVLGAVNGIKGVYEGRLVDIGCQLSSPESMRLLMQTPAAALGSCRLKMKSPEADPAFYEQITKVMLENNVGYFVYIGGNDSMDTVLKLSRYYKEKGIDIKVMGAPKTVDNDLCVTDHTPGFPSAAKYIGATLAEIVRDCHVYDIPAVTIVEIMGRDAGWLAASACLARLNGCGGPQLIYLPEVPFDIDRFVEDVKKELEKNPAVVVAVSEGIRDENGVYTAEANQSGAVDAFGHKYLAGIAKYLESVVRDRIGCKARGIELNLPQRCAAHILSATDVEESRMQGAAAAERAISGFSGEMAAVKRISSKPYRTEITTVPIEQVANEVSSVPRSWINEAGNDVTEEMVEYLYPLIQGELNQIFENGLPKHISLY
ncbi:MAG: 6-phosphofructokinase [Oscillospiraceae bacterium]|nr:6-phosphofructokinase [Oscillospiraceae bacterium]MBQ8731851.1 6-phosphofructokinase [Oscillospiraceae bacterium]